MELLPSQREFLPIAFNPNQNLKAAAEEAGWRIVVEKKDVIYEIDPKSIAKNK